MSRPGRGCHRPRIETLENRRLLAPLVVLNVEDSGAGSLRQAILDANAAPDPDTIQFQISSGVQTIVPQSALPTLNAPVTIDGTTQPGYDLANPRPMIALDGARAGANVDGLTIAGVGSTIRGLSIGDFGSDGIAIKAGSNTVAGCYLGLDPSGLLRRINGSSGIELVGPSSSDNTIGGTTADDRNVGASNVRDGITINGGGQNNSILGNFVGTDATGTVALSNDQMGVNIDVSSGNSIGA